jgi:malonyl CoA-acyl carrier protein transacylase
VATVTKEYLGNAFLEIEAALKKGKTQFVLSAGQMEQLLRVHAEVTEAKNEVVRENVRFKRALESIAGETHTPYAREALEALGKPVTW